MQLILNKGNVEKGFGMVEVLIAVFVLAIGILGIAGLQLFAKQNTYDAVQRTSAATLASGIAERIRMNPGAAESYISSAEPVPATAPPSDTADTTNCLTANDNCTPANIAARDLRQWYSAIMGSYETSKGNAAGGIVAPSACISRPDATNQPDEYRIAIAWRGRTPLSNPTLSTCGEGAPAGTYGSTKFEYRRLFVMDISLK